MSLKVKAFLFAFCIIILDQISKLWVKTHMAIGDSISVFGDWFYIQFIENPGMIFGISWGGYFGKLMLVLVRIVMAGAIAWYIPKLINRKFSTGVIFAMAAIFAGAIGNVIDCVFYGVFFTSSEGQVAQLFSEAAGYAPWFQGKVVDMLYFPLVDTVYPDWVPIFGGTRLQFFKYIFNIADSAVFLSIFYLLLFQRKTIFTEVDKE